MMLITAAQSTRCAEYASRGCKVYATARRMEAMHGLTHSNVEKLVLDVTDEKNINDVVDTVISKEGRIDVLVNNAGVLCIGTESPGFLGDSCSSPLQAQS